MRSVPAAVTGARAGVWARRYDLPVPMTALRRLACFALAAALGVASGLPGRPAQAETVDDKPRLAVSIAQAPAKFASGLGARLAGMRRFTVVDGGSARGKLGGIPLTPAITLAQARRARTAAGLELLLDGRYQASGGQVRVTARLFDFRTAEFSRDLSLVGDAASADTLAAQLAAFVRQAVPLRCRIKDLEEDVLILDLGEADGVTAGTVFRVIRHPLNMAPRELGTIRVTTVQPFACRAEVEDAPKGTVFERDAVAVEQTSNLLFK